MTQPEDLSTRTELAERIEVFLRLRVLQDANDLITISSLADEVDKLNKKKGARTM